MAMLSEQRIREAIREQVVITFERAAGYHQRLAETLIVVVSLQIEGLSDRNRKEQAKRLIVGLGEEILRESEGK